LNFLHSGKLGDLVWAIPSMRSVATRAGQEKISIYLNNKYSFFSWDINAIKPLLDSQSYVKGTDWYRNDVVATDGDVWWLDEFRAGRMKPDWNIPRFVCNHFKLPYTILDEPWLKVTPNKKAKYVFCKNQQDVCDNPRMPWKSLVERYADESIFLGWGPEAYQFADRFGRVCHHPTSNLLQAAEIIAGCEKVFCSQSVHHAIAEALKKDIMLECSPAFPSVIFNRPGVVNVL
jgi:hypothetical protein